MATSSPLARPSQQPVGLEEEDICLDEYDLYGLALLHPGKALLLLNPAPILSQLGPPPWISHPSPPSSQPVPMSSLSTVLLSLEAMIDQWGPHSIDELRGDTSFIFPAPTPTLSTTLPTPPVRYLLASPHLAWVLENRRPKRAHQEGGSSPYQSAQPWWA